MNRVVVFTLGGTISARGGGATRMTGAEVLAVAGTSDTARVELRDFRRLPSSSLAFDDVAALAREIDAVTGAGAGAVVVQGTDTLEETAFLLDLICTVQEPVVVTGAMRRADLPGADGPANLAAAIAVAGATQCRGLGVLVVSADEIHSARHARKTHTTSVATFASPGAGPLGTVVEGTPRILLRPARPLVERPLALRRPVRVGLLTLTLGDGGELLDGIDDRFEGLVLAAFGAGHVPAWLVDPLERLAARIPVVLASRTGAGPMLHQTYRGPGSEYDVLSPRTALGRPPRRPQGAPPAARAPRGRRRPRPSRPGVPQRGEHLNVGADPRRPRPPSPRPHRGRPRRPCPRPHLTRAARPAVCRPTARPATPGPRPPETSAR